MEHPKAVGDRSQLAIMLALVDAGFDVYLPFGENTRCDLVIDDGDQLGRVQCKTGRLRTGAVRFSACSNYAHHTNPRAAQRDYLGDIDYFGVYCPQTDGVYLVPIAEVQVRRVGALRVDPPLNGQTRGIRQATDYEVAEIGIRATAGPGGRPGAAGSCA
jgi:PD-(D/E)XK endonuclease